MTEILVDFARERDELSSDNDYSKYDGTKLPYSSGYSRDNALSTFLLHGGEKTEAIVKYVKLHSVELSEKGFDVDKYLSEAGEFLSKIVGITLVEILINKKDEIITEEMKAEANKVLPNLTNIISGTDLKSNCNDINCLMNNAFKNTTSEIIPNIMNGMFDFVKNLIPESSEGINLIDKVKTMVNTNTIDIETILSDLKGLDNKVDGPEMELMD